MNEMKSILKGIGIGVGIAVGLILFFMVTSCISMMILLG
jgi:tetrahydromethanopterin S-methyltransferase subunit G